MWSKKRVSVTYTPRSLKRPTVLLKRRISTIERSSSNIKVVVRVRPPSDKDSLTRQVVQVIDENCVIFDPKEDEEDFYVGGHKQLNRDMLKKRHKDLAFQFDRVFDQEASNQEVFEGTTQDLISSLLDGFNCSVFVYGATGAGKTYTMLGSKETPGIAFLTVEELYKRMGERADYKFDINISYLEVYNEMVKDLICPSGPLHLRDDGKDGIIISGIKTHHIDSADELFQMLEYGNRNRTQHPTDANAESSRSHAVFQVHLCITHKLTVETKIAKLTMIDLAGSERGAATGGKGLRFSEGSNINKSLLALGNCVDALAEGHKHIPYRNSKLTRILKDSLGGNCKTVMIVNVAPASIAYEETFNTLNYAIRAKKISNKIRRNLLNVDMSACQYKKIIEELKQRNIALENEVQTLKTGKVISTDGQETYAKTCPDIDRGRRVLRDLNELEGKYQKELLFYQIKKKTLDWRIHQKQVINKRFQLFEYMLGESKSQSRMDECVTKLKMQRKVYKEKVKSLQKLLREKRNLREVALKDITEKGLIGELQKDIDHYAGKLKEDGLEMQVKYFKDLLKKQQHEMTSSDNIISHICKTMDYYYSILNGSNQITEQMKKQYVSLVQQLSGIKGVSWEDETCEYTILQKVMDLSFISEDSRESVANCAQDCDYSELPTENIILKTNTHISSPVRKCLSPVIDNYCIPCTPSMGLRNIAQYVSPEGDEAANVSPRKEQIPTEITPVSLKLFATPEFNKTFVMNPSLNESVNTANCVTNHLETVPEEMSNSRCKNSTDVLNTTYNGSQSPNECGTEVTTSVNSSQRSAKSPSLDTTFTKDTPSPIVRNQNTDDCILKKDEDSSSVLRSKAQMVRSNLPTMKTVSSSSSVFLCVKPGSSSSGRQPITTSAKDKLPAQPDRFKVRPGAPIKIQYTVLSDKNKIIPKVPMKKNYGHNNGRKQSSQDEKSSSQPHLKENRIMVPQKRNSRCSPTIRTGNMKFVKFTKVAPEVSQDMNIRM